MECIKRYYDEYDSSNNNIKNLNQPSFSKNLTNSNQIINNFNDYNDNIFNIYAITYLILLIGALLDPYLLLIIVFIFILYIQL